MFIVRRRGPRLASVGPTARSLGTLQLFTGDPSPVQLNRGVVAVPSSNTDSAKHVNLGCNECDVSDISVEARSVKPLCLRDTRGMGAPL